MRPRLLLLLLVLPAAAAASPRAHLLSSVEGGVPDATEKLVRLGTAVELLAVLELPQAIHAIAPRVKLGAGSRRCTPPPPGARVRWYRIEPAAPWVSNTEPTWHWAEIPYRDVPLPACADRWTCPAAHVPGTAAYRVEIDHAGATHASPGAEELFRGGLRPEVHRITVRRDDGYLGLLTELFGTPYIWGSAGRPDARHQAERRIGSDCADFVTYGVRRLGHDVPYTSTLELHRFARRLYAVAAPGSDGIYRTADGRPVPFGEGGVRPGDLLLFPRHVGALVEDRPPLGVLSATDVMVHTCFAPPAEEPIGSTQWVRHRVEVLRWKVLE